MQDAAKKNAVRHAKLLRQANRMQVLVDLCKATSDSIQSLLAEDGNQQSRAREQAGAAGGDTSRPQDPGDQP